MTQISIIEFAGILWKVVKTDRGQNFIIQGDTGDGKSTLNYHIMKAYSKVSGIPYDLERITWSRKTLLKWINGEEKTGKGQLPEGSAIHIDELFHMFYRRTWYDGEQIDGVTTLNQCRDRHLVIGGCNPNAFVLDSDFLDRMDYMIYIPYRGVAVVFQKEKNPFNPDKWNQKENMKRFRKYKSYERCIGYVGTISFPDWPAGIKDKYLEYRNKKRILALDEARNKRGQEKYAKIKNQRDALIREYYEKGRVTQEHIANLTGMERAHIGAIINFHEGGKAEML